MLHFLIPGVENAEEPDFGAEMFGITSDLYQGLSTGLEQQTVDEFLVLKCEWCQRMREREDDVNVARGQELFTACLDPAHSGVGLTLGAVPVSTRVVRDGAMPATGTLIQMPAESSRAAALDRR